MVFYTELKEYEDIEPTLEGAPPSLWEYVGAVSQDMWNSNPTTSAIRAYELSQLSPRDIKSRAWAGSVGLQLPAGGTPLSAAYNKKIYTEADLVNLRRKHPGLYQEGNRKAAALVEQKSGAAPRAGGDPGLPKLHEGDAPREYAAPTNDNLNQTVPAVNGIESMPEETMQFFGLDRLVFMLEMADAKGATVVVPLHLDGTKDRTTIHIATTVYAKERKGKPDNAWFEKQAGNALYINRQKEKRWLMSSGSNSLWDAANALSGENIRTGADPVNRQKEKRWLMFSGSNSLWNATNALSGKNVRTDEYLVKLKRQHPALYSNGSDIAHVVFKENPVRGEGVNRTQWNYYGHKIKNTDASGKRAWLNERVPSTKASVFEANLYDALKSIKNRGSRIPESVDFMYQEGMPQALDADVAHAKLRQAQKNLRYINEGKTKRWSSMSWV